MMGHSSMEKFRNSTGGVRFGSHIRMMAAFHAGVVVTLILVLGVALPLSYMRSHGHYHRRTSSQNTKVALYLWGNAFQQKWSVKEKTVLQKDWEPAAAWEVHEEDLEAGAPYGEVPRKLIPMGTGNFLFTHFSTYRTGPKSFAVLGLGPRLMHKFWSKPGFQCFWNPNDASPSKVRVMLASRETTIEGTVTNYYTQELEQIPTTAEYTTVVVYCTFEFPVGVDGKGGELRVIANQGEQRKNTPLGSQSVEFVALSEERGMYDGALFEAPFEYEYLCCGGPLYGSVNPHRLREWLAYHMRLLGDSSHFILYDNGGIKDDSWKVLGPWVKLGRLTIMNVRQEARYDTYYHGQFLFTNDCLLRAKSLAKWAFFFDVDEYLQVSEFPNLDDGFHKIMSELAKRGRRATSIQLQQRLMSDIHCPKNHSASNTQKSPWAIEKLVYRRTPDRPEVFEGSRTWTPLDDFKSAVQPSHVLVMGVHEPAEIELPPGYTKEDTRTRLDVHFEGCQYCFDDKLHYYHYHGITSKSEELCKEFVSPHQPDATINLGGAKHKMDDSMHQLATYAQEYELKTIGRLHL